MLKRVSRLGDKPPDGDGEEGAGCGARFRVGGGASRQLSGQADERNPTMDSITDMRKPEHGE